MTLRVFSQLLAQVGTLTEEPYLACRPLMLLLGLHEQIFGYLQKAGIGYEGDGVGDALLFALVVDGGHSEAGIRSVHYLRLGPSFSQARDQQCRDQASALAIEDEQRMVNVLLVIAVVEGALLIPSGWDLRLRRSPEAPSAEHHPSRALSDRFRRAPRLFGGTSVCPPRSPGVGEGRLACQIAATLG